MDQSGLVLSPGLAFFPCEMYVDPLGVMHCRLQSANRLLLNKEDVDAFRGLE